MSRRPAGLWFGLPLLGVVALALAACGGGNDSQSSDADVAQQTTVAVSDAQGGNVDGGTAEAPPDGSGTADQGGPATDSGGITLAVGPGLSVPEAIDSELDELLLVNGFIVAQGDSVRLCEALAESFPPQCGGRSLTVEGLNLANVDGLQREGDVQWANQPFQVLGDVENGVITVSATSQG